MLDNSDSQKLTFKHFGSEIVPGCDIILGILEDNSGKIWLSSENGLIRLDPQNLRPTKSIIISMDWGFNNSSENTCFKRQDGSLIFGGNLGFEVIRPEKINPVTPVTRIELTKFMLFNKGNIHASKDSPLKKSISFQTIFP